MPVLILLLSASYEDQGLEKLHLERTPPINAAYTATAYQ